MILIQGPISTDKISAVIEQHNEHGVGAHTIFLGKVRADIIDGKKVKEIEYSAYEEMVVVEVEKIRKHIVEKYNQVSDLQIYHSVGIVKAGELSLFVFVASGHRKQAFEASEEAVELIKENLPVWKREIFEDGEYVWTENKK